MKKFTNNSLFSIRRIQEAALQVSFSADQRKNWTSIDDLQHGLDCLTSDDLIMKANNSMPLSERQNSCAIGVLASLAYCLGQFLDNPQPSENEVSLNDQDLKQKLIQLSQLTQ